MERGGEGKKKRLLGTLLHGGREWRSKREREEERREKKRGSGGESSE